MRKYIFEAHDILRRIYRDGSYSDDALNKSKPSPLALKITYGVLENDLKLDYIISQLTTRKPKQDALILLKIGAYSLLNLDDVPKYAIVSECVEAAKRIPDARGASGFVNAVLKKISAGEFRLKRKGESGYLSVEYSKPQWFVDRLTKEYGEERVLEAITAPACEEEHIRVNRRKFTARELEKALAEGGDSFEKTPVGGYITRVNDVVKQLFAEGKITYQSPSSMLAVKALGVKDGADVLDMCSAPGGKAVYMSEFDMGGRIVACELYPHRIAQIEKYKERMGANNILSVQCDASKYNEKWKDSFDYVLVDAPCSCFGTYVKHPDVFLQRGEEDVKKLAQTQSAILKTAMKYVKVGGKLVYSTCTLFDEENIDVVKGALNDNFKLCRIEGKEFEGNVAEDGTVRILPNGVYDGFFIAKLKRVK